MKVIDVNRKYIVDLPKRHKHIENNIFILSSRDFSVKNNFKISITIILKTLFLGREQHLP